MTQTRVQLFLSLGSFALMLILTVSPGCQEPQRGDLSAHAASVLSNPTKTTTKTPAQDVQESDQTAEDKTVLAVSKAIRKNHLTDLKDECLNYQFASNPNKDFYSVDVRENHRYAKCGGDPNTSPRLFSVKVDKKSGKMTTDQGSTDGSFHPLPD